MSDESAKPKLEVVSSEEPNWPDIKPAEIIRRAFKDKGRLIDSTDHVLVQKWTGRDRG